jgi:uncharacterized protein
MVLAFILVAYVGFFLLGGCADKFILFPSTHAVRARAERRTIPYAGGELDVVVTRTALAAKNGPDAYVLTFTGNAGRAEHHADDVADWEHRAVEMWAVNHPGFGKSTGPAKLSRMPDAALATYDALAKHANGKPIIINGISLGTTLSMHVASQRPVAGMILRTPLPLRSLILQRHGWWNLWVLSLPVASGVPAALDTLRTAPRVTSPAVFVLIDTDEVIPLKYQQKVVDAYKGEKTIVRVAEGDHNVALTGEVHGQLARGVDWLWDKVVRK